MSLKKSVCMECRTKELGEDAGWNTFAESWFDPWIKNGVETREGHTYCPYPIFERMIEHMKELIRKHGTLTEKTVLDSEIIHMKNKVGSVRVRTDSPPAEWCPYKKEH